MLKENLRFSEPFHGFSSLLQTTKKTSERMSFSLVDDQGAFAMLKENLRFSEPFHGFSSLVRTTKKTSDRMSFSLVDDQGLEPWAH